MIPDRRIDIRALLRGKLAVISQKTKLAEAIRYAALERSDLLPR
jgi:hypothetical protein